MSSPSPQRSLLIAISVFFFIGLSTLIITLLARGYQLNFRPNGLPTLSATGIISLVSKPKGASVYINDHLVTATDDSLNLPPDTYSLTITKDGFLPWTKTIPIQKEIVSLVEVQLFRSAPDLKPITTSGAINPSISPDHTKIVFAIASASASKDNGLYFIDNSPLLLPLNRNTPRQIITNFPHLDWSTATFTFSPDSQQVLAKLQNGSHYLFNPSKPISQPQLYDITPSLDLITQEWQQLEQSIIDDKVSKLPPELIKHIATDSAKNIYYSSDESKLLYLSSNEGELAPGLITTPTIGPQFQPQQRSIKANHYYIYDLKQDANYLLGSTNDILHPFWLPNSDNLIFIQGNSIKAIDYDATNQQTVFAGKFNTSTTFPWSDGNKIITLTSPYTGAHDNLYSITIR